MGLLFGYFQKALFVPLSRAQGEQCDVNFIISLFIIHFRNKLKRTKQKQHGAVKPFIALTFLLFEDAVEILLLRSVTILFNVITFSGAAAQFVCACSCWYIAFNKGNMNSACLYVTDGALQQSPFSTECLLPQEWVLLILILLTLAGGVLGLIGVIVVIIRD